MNNKFKSRSSISANSAQIKTSDVDDSEKQLRLIKTEISSGPSSRIKFSESVCVKLSRVNVDSMESTVKTRIDFNFSKVSSVSGEFLADRLLSTNLFYIS